MKFRSFSKIVALLCVLALGCAEPVSAATDEEEAAALYEKALQAFGQDDFATAAIHLKNVLAAAPRLLAAHVLLGRTYLKQGDGAQAEKELKIAQRLGADQSIVVLPLAEAYEKQFKYQQLLQDIVSGNFKPAINAEIQVKRGDAYLEEGQTNQALFAYREAARYAPDTVAPLLGQASALRVLHRTEEAEALANRALDIDPRDPLVWYTKGAVSQAQGRLQKALKHYTHGLELDPQNYRLRLARAGVHMEQGMNSDALSDLDALYTDDSYDPRVAYLLGVVQARLGDVDASKAAFARANQILNSLPEEVIEADGETLLLASLVESSVGERERARGRLEHYISKYPDNPVARKLLGSILYDRASYDAAIRVLEPALKQAPSDYQLLTLLGKAYLEKGWNVVALETLHRAVAAGGADGIEARVQLGLAQLAVGKDEAGIEQLRDVFLHSEKAREAGVALATAYLKRNENQSAVDIARLLVKRNPEDLKLLNLLAGAETAAGDLDAARSHLEEILHRDPGSIVAAINLAKLERSAGHVAEARKRLDALSSEHGSDSRVLVAQARLEESEGHADVAINLVEKAVALDESRLEHQLYLGELYLKSAAFEKLGQLEQKLERLFPRNLQVKRLIGRGHLAQGELQKARLEFQNMSKLAGEDARAFVDAASLSRAAGDLDWAAWSLQNAIKIKPEWLQPRLALADVYLQAGKRGQAADVLTYLMANYPDHAETHRRAGDLAMAQGEVPRAIEAYRKALQKGGGPDIVLRLYRAYLASGDVEGAVEFVKGRLPKLDKSTPHPQLTIALAEGYLHLKDYRAAASLYEELVASGLKQASVFNNLAMIYFRDGDSRAVDMARQAYALAPERPRISDTLGWLLVRTGRPAEGLRYLRAAHLRDSSDPGIRYHIAVALVDLARTGEAGEELREILSDAAPFAERPAAAALLRRIGGGEQALPLSPR